MIAAVIIDLDGVRVDSKQLWDGTRRELVGKRGETWCCGRTRRGGLAAGIYGRSIESGAPIPDEQLEAIPTAERTAEEEAG